MNPSRYIFFILFLISFKVKSQDNKQLNAAEIKLALQKLNVTGNVLYIAAHPDDENTRLLSYLASERKFRTGYLSITRGDGGQNLLGTEQAELLGIIRTQELLAARKVDGAEQFFTRAIDFGFSKTSDESLQLWGKEQILADVVWIIRNFKPDVIITRFPEDSRAGHGQHAASAILAREAFSAAADSSRFPEQLKSIQPWQAKRLVWNTSNFGGTNTNPSENQVKLNVGLYNPLLGKSYGEIAALSRSNHKSQGFGSAAQRGDFTEIFTHVAGTPAKTDLFEDVNTSWSKLPGTAELPKLITKTENDFDTSDPSKSIEVLLKIKSIIDKTGIDSKSQEVNAVIIACAGLWFEMNSNEPQYAIGDSIPVRLQAILRVPASFKYKVFLNESLSKTAIELVPNKFNSINTKIGFKSHALSQPYWLETEHSQGAYVIKNSNSIGLPENTVAFNTDFIVKIEDQNMKLASPVVYKYTDPVRGEIYQPITIAPPVTATVGDKAIIFSANKPQKITIQLQSFKDNSIGVLQPKVPAGWRISPANSTFTFPRKGEITSREFIISPSENSKPGNLLLDVKIADQVYTYSYKEIKHEHIPVQTLFPPAGSRLENINLKIAGNKIAYIAGAGDLVAESLKQIGYDVTALSPNDILKTNLTNFDAIVTGVRLYNVSKEMKLVQPVLLEYVKNGGIVLVQYNVNNNLQVQNIGPYPFSINRDRVTEEDAKVSFLKPEHRVLNYPNRITEKDFDGWVQERGLYFTTQADRAYSSILSFNDKGENPNDGSLIVADYGKGRFVYTSLAFFRQLPAGVPGAYRLFANLISR